MYVADTIAAIATAPGVGGVGIVRVSGPGATAIAERVIIATQATAAWVSHRLYRGQLCAVDGAVIDDGLAVLMRAPNSYTGEDVLELHCHGSPVVLRHVLMHVLASGARLAEPGEFTKRAFLNGRLDLAQAEAVIDLVGARSEAGAVLAAAQLGGQLSAALGRIRDDLVHLKALLEAQIDFAEDEVQIAHHELLATLNQAETAIVRLVDTFKHGSLVRDGLRVVIVGKPNVGKSSLLNALLGSDRAIVTEVAGTTRDTIDEVIDFAGVPVVLTDTAGLRDEALADPVERIGMARTGIALRQAQVRLVVLDASRAFDSEDQLVLDAVRDQPYIVVLNKSDLAPVSTTWDGPCVRVSAKALSGLEELRQAVVQLVERGEPPRADDPVISNARHRAALLQCLDALRLARQSIDEARPPDLIAVDVQAALDHIGTITGAVSSEDVLDRIFAEFCIGK